MILSRRDFLNACKTASVVLGLSALDIIRLQELLANPNAPSILWLQGSACTGCTVSFLNYISMSSPVDIADLLINDVNLVYHNTAMAAVADSGVDAINTAYAKGNYILAIEGGVPTSFNGNACIAWSWDGEDVTFMEAVRTLAARASKILSIGTCASYGGLAAASPNPTGVKGVETITGIQTINIAGCPPHPDWIVWTIARLLLGNTIAVDSYRRPRALYSSVVHGSCPRRNSRHASTYGQDRLCLKDLACYGPKTRANCPSIGWNNHSNWCTESNAQCIGCTEPDFPNHVLRSSSLSRGV